MLERYENEVKLLHPSADLKSSQTRTLELFGPMLPHLRSSLRPHHRGWRQALWLIAWLQGIGALLSADPAMPPPVVSPTVITSFEQIWQMKESDTKEWHRLRMEYVVYYYDPLWSAMWGRSGAMDNYLSVGSIPFPIKSGERILVEGLILPAKGMIVAEPRITVLAESVAMEVLPIRGEIGNVQRFTKHLVTVDGYVDRQEARDANHQELDLIVEGQCVLVKALVRTGETVPQLKGSLVRVQGVYFARNEPTSPLPKVEIWVPGIQTVEVLGPLDQDERFRLPAIAFAGLPMIPAGQLARVTGTVLAQEPGKSVTLGDGTDRLVLQTAQTQILQVDEKVEAIGLPRLQGGQWTLQQALYRHAQRVLTNFDDILQMPEPEKSRTYQVKLDCAIFYFDPYWKVAWGRCAGVDGYLSLDAPSFPLKPGQQVLIEGQIVPASGMKIQNVRTTLLAESTPMEVLSTRGEIGRTERFDKHLVTVEGYVDRQAVTDPHHLELDLVTEGLAVTVRLLLMEIATVPDMEGMLLNVKGAYSATIDASSAHPKVEVWVQGLQDIETKGSIAQDRQFELPATAIENLAALPPTRLVRVAGVVRMQQAGKSLTIRDATGQLTLETAQTHPVQLGEQVEAIGYPRLDGTEWRLRDSLYRRQVNMAPALAPEQSILRLADQLRELPPAEAARGYPVNLSGIVTWTNPAADFFFIRDGSGGVCVFQPPVRNREVLVGSKVTVTGVSGTGKFTPVVLATAIQVGSTIDLPEPKQVTLEQALTGIEEAQWVTMSGYVRAVTQDGPWARLELTTAAGEFSARLPWNNLRLALRHSVVRMRGVCTALTNGKRQLTGIQLFVPSGQYVEIEEAEPADPFTTAAQSIASLRQFGSLLASNRRVRVTGVVVQDAPGLRVQIQDGSECLLVLSHDAFPLVPGDRIEAVGLPGRENSRFELREAVYRRLSSGPEPLPLEISAADPVNVEWDGRLVRMNAMLLDLGAQEKGTRLIMQEGAVIFEALLDAPKSTLPDNWVAGSRLALTGVYQIQFDEYKRPHTVQLQLRTLGDVRILSHAPWWTVARALTATAVLAVGIVLGFGWVVALRRRVRRQTGQIREQVENEKAARLEAALARASKLESLGVLAGGIAHDFNNLLTVVMGNLSLARLDPRIEPETVECLRESERAALRARDLTQQLITFAKGGEPMRAVTSLPEVVREATRFALHGSKARSEYDFAPGLWSADIDKGQIGQVVHNIIINAAHAMPGGGVIRIALRNEEIAPGTRPAPTPGRYLHLTIADTGTGIEPEFLPRIFEPYFTTKARGSGLGLATVYSIIKKHQGHIEVESRPGAGTAFHLWLPAAAERPGTAAPGAAAAGAVKTTPTPAARVLFMDDEAPIRQLAGAILARMGLDYTVVADGVAVLREYETARAAGRPYDLVMLDLTVPGGMGGAEAMDKLRQMDPAVRAIVSSGYSNDPVMANYRAHGFQGRVSKPYEMSEFMKTINAVLPDGAGASADVG